MFIIVANPPYQRGETDFFAGEPLRALSTLVFSENIDLQRSASLTFAEITERGTQNTPSPPACYHSIPAREDIQPTDR